MRMQIGSAERVNVVIEVKNLSKSYKDFQAVKDSTFTVDKGRSSGFSDRTEQERVRRLTFSQRCSSRRAARSSSMGMM